MMNDQFEKISTDLINKTNELHFIQASLYNLEKVKAYQEAQKDEGWSYFTNNAINDFKDRSVQLENHIRSLKSSQEDLYKELRQS
jgi:chaperonin cofactor prefoldin